MDNFPLKLVEPHAGATSALMVLVTVCNYIEMVSVNVESSVV